MFVSQATLAETTESNPIAKVPNPNAGMFFAPATRIDLSPKLPEPFKLVSNVLVNVDYPNKRVMLSFVMPPASKDSAGGVIRVGWAYQEDVVDKKCGVRTIKAVAPKESTPYYENFVITVMDYLHNTCEENKGLPKTQVIFETFEIAYNEKTQSSIWADALTPIPRDAENPWVNRKKEEVPANSGAGTSI